MIQFGSTLAVMWLYRDTLIRTLRGLLRERSAQQLALAIVVAFIPAAIVGLLAADYVERVLHQSIPVIATAFIVGGVIMLVVERMPRKGDTARLHDISLGQALAVGVSQAAALVPGVSRSGSTIVGGLLAGLTRPTAAEFSFFVAMPTMSAAFVHSAWEMRHQISSDRISDLAIGFVAAFIASALVVKPFLAVVRCTGFAAFAWYRIVLGVVLLTLVARGIL